MCLDPNGAKTVLIAPAWNHFRQTENATCRNDTMILHCQADEIVAYSDSQELSDKYGATLIKAGACHRMNDSDALEALEEAVKWANK